jgi:hypothetical protein
VCSIIQKILLVVDVELDDVRGAENPFREFSVKFLIADTPCRSGNAHCTKHLVGGRPDRSPDTAQSFEAFAVVDRVSAVPNRL